MTEVQDSCTKVRRNKLHCTATLPNLKRQPLAHLGMYYLVLGLYSLVMRIILELEIIIPVEKRININHRDSIVFSCR